MFFWRWIEKVGAVTLIGTEMLCEMLVSGCLKEHNEGRSQEKKDLGQKFELNGYFFRAFYESIEGEPLQKKKSVKSMCIISALEKCYSCV